MMNLEYIKLVDDVVDFSVYKDYLAYTIGNSLFDRSLYINSELIQKSNTSTFFFYRGYFIFSTWDPDTYIIDVKYEISKFKLSGYSCSDEVLDDFFFISKKNEKMYDTLMVNVNTHEMINVGNDFSGKIIAGKRVMNSKNYIDIFNIHGDFLWNYSLTEISYDWYTKSNYENAPNELRKGEISGIIGFYSETLWIVLNSGVILGLANDTGKLTYELVQPNNYGESKEPFNPAINTQIDSERGILFGLRNKYYWEIDLLGPENTYLLYDISASCDNWNISADMPLREWSWFEDKIYFGEIYDSPHNQNLNNVGVFDRKTREVVYAMRIGEGGRRDMLPNIQKIQFEAGRLYVLDGRQVLHILEED